MSNELSFVSNERISLKREMAVSKEVMNEASKKMSRAEKDERY